MGEAAPAAELLTAGALAGPAGILSWQQREDIPLLPLPSVARSEVTFASGRI